MKDSIKHVFQHEVAGKMNKDATQVCSTERLNKRNARL